MSSLKAVSAESVAPGRSAGALSPSHPLVTSGSTAPAAAVHCFSVRADLDPGLLPRLLEPFAKRGLWPSKFYSQALSSDLPGQPAEAVIDIQVAGLDCATSDHIAIQFRGIVGVQSVLTSLRASAD
ncbi:MAG TPA: hypothetical protein VM659_07325 [Dongiaceae bacterium]|nr:hypothetical protein [Dongiaceae bacterium]